MQVLLKDGTRAERALVEQVLERALRIRASQFLLFYEFVSKTTRYPNHVFHGEATVHLKAAGLVEEDGTVREPVRRILANAVAGEGEAITLTVPYAQ